MGLNMNTSLRTIIQTGVLIETFQTSQPRVHRGLQCHEQFRAHCEFTWLMCGCHLFWDTKIFLGDTKKLFVGYRNFFGDTETFSGIQNAFSGIQNLIFRETKVFG